MKRRSCDHPPATNDAVAGVGPSLSLAALRLLAPPIRLVSAATWRVVSRREARHYGKVVEFVEMVSEVAPEILNYRHRAKITLGLRAKIIMEMLERRSPPVQILAQLEKFVCPASPKNTQPRQRDIIKVQKSVENFRSLVQSLLKEERLRNQYLQETLSLEYGDDFLSALEKLFWEFLLRLDQILSSLDFKQIVSAVNGAPCVLEELLQQCSDPQPIQALLQYHREMGRLDPAHQESEASWDLDSVLCTLQNSPNALQALTLRSAQQQHSQSEKGSKYSAEKRTRRANQQTEGAGPAEKDTPTVRREGGETGKGKERTGRDKGEGPVCKDTPSKKKGDGLQLGGKGEGLSYIKRTLRHRQLPLSGKGDEEKDTPHKGKEEGAGRQEEEGQEVRSVPCSLFYKSRKRVRRSSNSEVEDSGLHSELASEGSGTRRNSERQSQHLRRSSRNSSENGSQICWTPEKSVRYSNTRERNSRDSGERESPQSLRSRVTASCHQRKLTVVIRRLDFQAPPRPGVSQQEVRKEGQEAELPELLNPKRRKRVDDLMTPGRTRPTMTSPGETGSADEKENRFDFVGATGSAPLVLSPRQHEPFLSLTPLDAGDDVILDSEDEETKSFKGRLFLKKYYRTKYNTFIPTLREFLRPVKHVSLPREEEV
ncbi:uncharacterized protein LOC131730523 isoform X2 [Acipenser ruthenus]|uniref:uncharacterized protein LOC131730523 isoform X2 n=1 Tax=Acipenser ruthenus TaxID=7906 RepID=UPI002741960D|nr:uncharacterized protein LOC131730523 isoform X2 [Acipenser ruthenus]